LFIKQVNLYRLHDLLLALPPSGWFEAPLDPIDENTMGVDRKPHRALQQRGAGFFGACQAGMSIAGRCAMQVK
jgi:hypothetical protein